VRIDKIKRITPTGLVVVGEVTYTKTGLERTNDPWNRKRLEIVTDEHRKAVRRKELVNKVAALRNWDKLPTADLEAIVAILDKKRETASAPVPESA
jgi:hypothetical protein